MTSEEIPIDELKSKKSELRLYCDLLMQQVYSVKSAVHESPIPDVEVGQGHMLCRPWSIQVHSFVSKIEH